MLNPRAAYWFTIVGLTVALAITVLSLLHHCWWMTQYHRRTQRNQVSNTHALETQGGCPADHGEIQEEPSARSMLESVVVLAWTHSPHCLQVVERNQLTSYATRVTKVGAMEQDQDDDDDDDDDDVVMDCELAGSALAHGKSLATALLLDRDDSNPSKRELTAESNGNARSMKTHESLNSTVSTGTINKFEPEPETEDQNIPSSNGSQERMASNSLSWRNQDSKEKGMLTDVPFPALPTVQLSTTSIASTSHDEWESSRNYTGTTGRRQESDHTEAAFGNDYQNGKVEHDNTHSRLGIGPLSL